MLFFQAFNQNPCPIIPVEPNSKTFILVFLFNVFIPGCKAIKKQEKQCVYFSCFDFINNSFQLFWLHQPEQVSDVHLSPTNHDR